MMSKGKDELFSERRAENERLWFFISFHHAKYRILYWSMPIGVDHLRLSDKAGAFWFQII